MAWNYRWTGKSADIPLMAPMKWSFIVWIAFYSKLQRWSSGGTSWKVLWVFLISFLYAAKISLSRTWCFGTLPWSLILSNARHRAKIIPPYVLFLIGSIQVGIPSISCRIIWYWFYWIDWGGNFPVWSMYIFPLGSYTVKKTSRHFYSLCNLASLISCVCCWKSTLVDRNYWCWFHMWPLWVYSDYWKCLFKFFTVISGQF